MKRRANFSCMDVKEIVSLACSHRCGRAPRLSGWKKTLAWGWELFIMVASLSAAPLISISVGSSVWDWRAPWFFRRQLSLVCFLLHLRFTISGSSLVL